MASSVSHNSFSTIPLFVGFLVVASSLAHVLSSPLMSDSGNRQMKNHTFKPAKDIQKLRRINAYLKKINKPAVKTIQAGIFFPLSYLVWNFLLVLFHEF